MKKFTFIDLFAGIGGIRIPFQELGGKCVFTSEIDRFARETYKANFGEEPFGDINSIAPEDIPNHDILLAGFPCQAFSIIGNKKGFADTRGTLFFNIEKILQAKKPKAFLLENVKHLRNHDQGRTFQTIIDKLEELGYFVHREVLNALDFGLPQKRERTFIVGFKDNVDFAFPNTFTTKARLEDFLDSEDEIDPKLYVSEEIRAKRLEKCKPNPPVPSIWHENKSGNISALPYSCALRANGSYNYLLVNGVRRPSAREMLRLQGFPEDFKIVVSYTQLRKQAGNSVPVPVVRAIARQMMKAIDAAVVKKSYIKQKNMSLFGEIA